MIVDPNKNGSNIFFLWTRILCLWLYGCELIVELIELIIPQLIWSRTFSNKMFLNPPANKPGGFLWLIKIWHVCIHCDSNWTSGRVCGRRWNHFPSLWFLKNKLICDSHKMWGKHWTLDPHTLAFVCVSFCVFNISFWPGMESEGKGWSYFT